VGSATAGTGLIRRDRPYRLQVGIERVAGMVGVVDRHLWIEVGRVEAARHVPAGAV
jgi:hypothetical protein